MMFAVFRQNLKAGTWLTVRRKSILWVEEHFEIDLISHESVLEKLNSMTAAEELLVKTLIFDSSISDVFLFLRVKVVYFMDLNFVFSEGASFIETHDFQMSGLYSLFWLSAENVFPLESQ